ncbi:hypothetical protein UFOVP326_50 [uncultured Caudovirales phage]|uniref:Uncharacterized protein n=1 Tax=uncultured Caudovirales phage TaxID=2100421 RepID=A0A6J5M0Z7_9CAUD|nr:hypothetical protein UFOVP326_50 [uncultured Caudovirales phage]
MDRPPMPPRMVALLVQEVEEQRLTIRELRRRVDRLERLASVLLLRAYGPRPPRPPRPPRAARAWWRRNVVRIAATVAVGVVGVTLTVLALP